MADSREEVERALAELDESASPSQIVDRLFPILHAEIRAIASQLMQRERHEAVLQPTALAHELYLRLCRRKELSIARRTQFLAIATKTMERILIDQARDRATQKRGGGQARVSLSELDRAADGAVDAVEPASNALDLRELDGLLERLSAIDPRGARVVQLRVFMGLTMEEIAQELGVTRRTVQEDWKTARLWLLRWHNETGAGRDRTPPGGNENRGGSPDS